jgi:hypothetical protein
LLLTTNSNADEVPIETADQYVVVVRIADYLSQARSDAAASYYARQLRGIAGLAQFSELVENPELLRALIDQHLTTQIVEEWLLAEPSRIESLQGISVETDPVEPKPSRAAILAALRDLDDIDEGVWDVLIEILPKLMDEGGTRTLLAQITKDEGGRRATSETLGLRIMDRIEDARAAAEAYDVLLARQETTETDIQHFIETYPWLIGLDYFKVRPKHGIPRGELDFILERFDGFHDLLELKSPNDPIIVGPAPVAGVPPSASQYHLSPSLANALAQVHVYRDILTADEGLMERMYGLAGSRNPRVIIMIGQVAHLTEDRLRVLEQLNLSLHRVEVVPYDLVGRRAQAWLTAVADFAAGQAEG